MMFFSSFQEIANRPFICPNCGHRFYAKWYQIGRPLQASVYATGKAMLKCPECKEKDLCKWDSDN